MKKQADLLNGSILDKLLKFVIPLALTGMLQQLFNAADVAVIGTFCGKTAMAAVGSNTPIVGLLINLFVGISVGCNVVISKFIGQRNAKKVKEATHTAFLLAIICGLMVAVLGTLVAKPIVGLLGVPGDVSPYALLYLRIYFLGVPFIMLYNFEAAIFRSVGNTRTPLICLTIGGIINVICNLFFVLKLGMSVDGVALATVIANIISSSMLFYFLTHEKSDIKVEIKSLRINTSMLKQILRIGLPSGIQGMVFSISNLCIQSAINSLGSDVMAASSAAFNIEIFVYHVSNAFGQACVTFIGQNYGANNKKRCKKIVKVILSSGMVATVAMSAVLIAFGGQLLSIFNSHPEIIALGLVRMKYILFGQPLSIMMETFSGTMRGLGKSMHPALIMLVAVCGSRIIWVYTVFAAHHSWNWLMAIYPISWFIAVIFLVIVYMRLSKKLLSERTEIA